MSVTDMAHAVWHRSSFSGNVGNCVEVADLGATVGVRDSKNPTGPALEFDREAFAAFINATKGGAFDLG